MDTEKDTEETFNEPIDHLPHDDLDPEPQAADQVVEPQAEEEDDDKRQKRRTYRTNQKLRREIDELRNQLSEVRTGHQYIAGQEHTQNLRNAEGAFNQAAQQLAAAHQSGDANQIIRAQAAFNQAQYTAMQWQNYVAAQKNKPQQQQPPKVKRAVRHWQERNDWYEDPDYEDETFAAKREDAKLAREWEAEGDVDDIGSKEYMDELERRLTKKLPQLFKGKQVERGRNVAGSSRNAATTVGRKGVDPRILEAARAMGKPVDDPKYIKRLESFTKKDKAQ